MDYLSDLFKKDNLGQVILVVLFLIYIIMGYKTPNNLANMIDTMFGKIVVGVIALVLLSMSNPILGVLGLFVAFLLIQRSSVATGSASLSAYCPTEEKRLSNLTAMNQFPYTLEQEVVSKMAPINNTVDPNTSSNFMPVLDNIHDAAPVGYTGVV
jgi:magnesium-transporting ATPase (P-type)